MSGGGDKTVKITSVLNSPSKGPQNPEPVERNSKEGANKVKMVERELGVNEMLFSSQSAR